ncbi:MAG: MotA/TolQ/ExbB proton channel family protein [Verrucomicrobia bacterium]|nr:MotA/TolQ/ExbB proton channel family protein [Verrucomicrobiota bacterium]
MFLLAEAAAAAASSPLTSITQFFVKGGYFMIPIGLCSLAAVTLMILRGLALRREMIIPHFVEREIHKFQAGDSTEPLARLVGGDPAPLARIARVALAHLRDAKADNVEAVQAAARVEVTKMESGLAGLELIVGLGPMLGLLGAVSGLVRVFGNLGSGTTSQADTMVVALGIAEALNSTIFGLCVAIPALIAFTYFQRRVESLAAEMESILTELLSKCYQSGRSNRPNFTAPPVAAEAAAKSGRYIETFQPVDTRE